MPSTNDLFRSMDAAEIEALGPMPVGDQVTPTTDRDSRAPSHTAEVHYAGVVEHASAEVADDDPFPPPRSMSAED
jgi:hypothetical protein